RIQEGLMLLHNRTAQRMLITGVGQSVSKKALIRQLNLSAPQLAIFHCCVDIEKTAMDTKGNAHAARMWAEANKFSTIRLVTANYHLARADLELKRLMPGHTIRSWPVIPPDLQLNGWYLHWPTFRLLAKEYAKYLLARIWL
ncbi:MAG: YdcF family protein, partial [Pseudomonadota bacterium]|nr:YdcF family protein [Pseudomonadota bacterium]